MHYAKTAGLIVLCVVIVMALGNRIAPIRKALGTDPSTTPPAT